MSALHASLSLPQPVSQSPCADSSLSRIPSISIPFSLSCSCLDCPTSQWMPPVSLQPDSPLAPKDSLTLRVDPFPLLLKILLWLPIVLRRKYKLFTCVLCQKRQSCLMPSPQLPPGAWSGFPHSAQLLHTSEVPECGSLTWNPFLSLPSLGIFFCLPHEDSTEMLPPLGSVP